MSAAIAASVGDALDAAIDALAAAGVETPRLDAELLLTEATGFERADLAADPSARVAPAAARDFGGMVRRRVRREPVAYILGRKGFRELELAVDSRVLIPRPETELLVEIALELRPHRVLDVGTGSGAIALAVADELPEAELVGTDPSPDALAVAEANRRRLGLGGRVRLERGAVPEDGEFDLMVANLPYVSEGEWQRLAPEIKRFEPREALTPGPTGLEAIEAVLCDLSVGDLRLGAVALEVGEGQAPTVAELVRRAGYGSVEARRDLAGIERVIVGSNGALRSEGDGKAPR